MFYFFIFITLSLVCFLEVEEKLYLLRYELAFVFASFLFVIAGFRYETGVDWLLYSENFKEIPNLKSLHFKDFFKELNPIFFALSVLIKYLGGGIQTLFAVMQFLASFFLWKSIKEDTEYRLLALLIYFSLLFFHLDMNLMKQAVSTTIFFYSLRYIIDRDLVKYTIFIILATGFHWSAILFFPLYFVIHRNYSTLLLSGLVAFFILFNLLQISTGNLVYKLSLILFGENSRITDKALFYTTSSIYSVKRVLNIGFIANSLIAIATLFFRENLKSKIKNFDVFLNLLLLQLFFYLVMYEFIELSGRLRFYTLISYIIILPYFISIIKTLKGRMIVLSLIILYSFTYVRTFTSNKRIESISYNPYQNYIIHKIFHKRSDGEQRLDKYNEYFEKQRSKNR